MTPSRPAAPAAPAERHGRAGARHAGSGRVRLHPVLRAVADALHVHHLCVSAKLTRLTLAADASVCVFVCLCDTFVFDEIKYKSEMSGAAPRDPSCLTADSSSGGAGTCWAFSWFPASRLASAVCSARSGIQFRVASETKWIYWVDYQLGQSVTGPDRVYFFVQVVNTSPNRFRYGSLALAACISCFPLLSPNCI